AGMGYRFGGDRLCLVKIIRLQYKAAPDRPHFLKFNCVDLHAFFFLVMEGWVERRCSTIAVIVTGGIWEAASSLILSIKGLGISGSRTFVLLGLGGCFFVM